MITSIRRFYITGFIIFYSRHVNQHQRHPHRWLGWHTSHCFVRRSKHRIMGSLTIACSNYLAQFKHVVCVCVCVSTPWLPVPKHSATECGQKTQNTLVKISINMGLIYRDLQGKSNLTEMSKCIPFWRCLRDHFPPVQVRMSEFRPNASQHC